ncbi:hypothetical protein GOP47_0009728 [Adiantum capillus-veneris]|uniref:ABC transmembrane type-1 domain-containing protein n=1 Tax=Adiantum capillus-veneris TaxID=13818 RepID=A0A9D4ZIZ6_ADICA|nr:hypothetical protein GOP47_0009728 [Adiantum capillus-veneris]
MKAFHCWMHTGQRQTSKMRLKYLEAILNQEVGFFDMDARTGTLVNSIAKDTVLVQDVVSEKVTDCCQILFSILAFASTFIKSLLSGCTYPMKMNCQVEDGLKLTEVKGDIELRNVVFSYPSRPHVIIFNNFSLSIPSGRTIALVGGSGSGRSTRRY